jgi:methionine synthase II (cobalamin-independent)
MSAFARPTGIGSWPGTTARQAAEVVVGELHSLTHLVELPARGVGADLIGRAGALLVDIAIDTVPRGYRIVARPGGVTKRAISLLDEDIDALEEAWEIAGLKGSDRLVKVQAPGPITLAAQLEMGNGHRAITDQGAIRDLTASLAEGVARHRANIARRLEAQVVVQFDEPTLPAAMLGRLTGVTAMTPVHPVDEVLAIELLDSCKGALGDGAEVAVHCCAADLPWKMLQRTTIDAISIDASTLKAADLDAIGELVEAGRTILLGVVPTLAPAPTPSAKEVAGAAASVTDRLGFARSVLLERIGITPTCGLAGATPAWARNAIELCQQAADGLAQDPEGT